MAYPPSRRDRFRQPPAHAALFIDYENLYRYLDERLSNREHPQAYISEMLVSLRRRLKEEHRTPAVLANAYADFGVVSGDLGALQRMLVEQDVAPRPTSAALGADAASLTLALEAVEAAVRPDLQLIVIVAGDRAYLPLVQHQKRLGREALVVTLASPATSDALPYLEPNLFLDTHALFSDASRRTLFGGDRGTRRAAAGGARREHLPITEPASTDTLEIIEEHFGQYDEVYLTPLLRKLSETFEPDDPAYDPKAVVADLERAGAVWLEKRRGFPYDYTVLLVDDEHPDVQRVQDAFDARENAYEDDAEPAYDDDYAGEDDYASEDDWAEPAH